MSDARPEPQSDTPERPAKVVLSPAPGLLEGEDSGSDPDQYLWGV